MNKNLANSRFFAEFFIGIVGLQQRSHVSREEGGILIVAIMLCCECFFTKILGALSPLCDAKISKSPKIRKYSLFEPHYQSLLLCRL